MEPAKVFVSSTWIDMIAERQAVEHAADRLRSIRFVGMEYFGARPEAPREVSLREVEACQVYVAVLGGRWGSGITEAEYRRARALDLPCLIYRQRHPTTPFAQTADDAARLAVWVDELSAAHTVSLFDGPQDLAAKLVADLHNLLFDRLVVDGVNRLHADYDVRIQRFMAEYLGTPRAPMPFGGREGELARLDRWLADAGAPAYALVGGPAGRGKSALLVHWVRRLTLDNSLDLVFFPISIRFRTNMASVAFASIAARMAELHGDPLLAGPETPSEVWRELVSGYLRRPPPPGRRLLVVLDGADEGADWQPGPDMFPAEPTERLHVVVSARYLAGDVDARGWLARLGWDRPHVAEPIDLMPLTPAGLVDVLRQTSLPLERLSARVDVVSELFRLTGGDPLLVHLYVADLWTRGEAVARLQPEDLQTVQPGLDGYFRRWWKDQHDLWAGHGSPLRAPTTEAIFNAMACALGPLRTAELLELLPPECRASIWTLEDVMRELQRFVVGDGQVQGYAFSHPRLGQHFFDRLAQAGAAEAQSGRFIEWGRRCLAELSDGRREPAEMPRYVLRYIRAHFDRADVAALEYVGLEKPGWAAAWECEDRGSYSGYAEDLRRVREVSAKADDEAVKQNRAAPLLAAELRGALGLATLATLAQDLSSALLGVLVERGVWTVSQAVAMASRIAAPSVRLLHLLTLVAEVRDTDRPLALAAAQAELRNLFASAPGREVMRSVLAEIVEGRKSPPQLSAALVAGVSRLAQLLSDAGQRDELVDMLDKALRGSKADAIQRVAMLEPLARTDATTTAHWTGALWSATNELAFGSFGHALAADRLRLLRVAIASSAEPSHAWSLAAVEAGADALALISSARGELDGHAGAMLCRAWPWLLRKSGVPPGLEVLAQALGAPALAVLQNLAGPQGDVAPTGLLRWWSQQLQLTPPRELAEAGARHLEDPAGKRADPILDGSAMPAEAIHEWLGSRTKGLGPADALAFARSVVRSGAGQALHAPIARWTLQLLARGRDARETLEMLAGLMDLLEPVGRGDSFEAWCSPPPALRVGGPPVRHMVRQLMLLGGLARDELVSVLHGLPVSSLIDEVGTEAAPLERRRARVLADEVSGRVLRGAAAATNQERDSSEPRGTDGLLTPESLASELVYGDAAARWPSQTLRLLAQSAERAGPDLLRETVPLLLDSGILSRQFGEHGEHYADVPVSDLVDILGLVASDALWPPSEQTLSSLAPILAAVWARAEADQLSAVAFQAPMPDAVRHVVLRHALLASERADVLPVDKLACAVARLSRPPESLVTTALRALGQVSPRRDELRDALVALVPVQSTVTWPRWLELALSTGASLEQLLAAAHDEALDPLQRSRDLVRALMQVRPPGRRLRAVVMLARDRTWLHPNMPWVELLDVARSLPGQEGLAARCACIPALPLPQRTAPLTEALALVAHAPEQAAVARTLVQLAVDLDQVPETLLNQAVETAVAIADRSLRGEAVASLAPVLDADSLAAAVASSRRIDDDADRVRAMLACARACRTRQAEAVALLGRAIDALGAGRTRPDATILTAPLRPPAERWPPLLDALRHAHDPRSGFRAEELFHAVVDAVADAPTHVARGALRWFERWPASPERSWALCQILPLLPDSLRMMATVMLGAGVDEVQLTRLADELTPEEVDAAHRAGPRLAEPTRLLFERVRHAQAAALDKWPDCQGADELDAPRVAAICRAAADDLERKRLVSRLASAALSPSLLAALVETTTAIGDATLRDAAVRALAVHAGPDAVSNAVDAVQGIDDVCVAAWCLTRLAMRLQGRQRDRQLDRALVLVGTEVDPQRRLIAACACAQQAPLLLHAVLRLVEDTVEEDPRRLALHRLLQGCGLWPDEALAAIVDVGGRALSEPRFARLVAGAASKLGPSASGVALEVAALMRHSVLRARVLKACASRLPDGRRDAALAMLDRIDGDDAWLGAMASVASRWANAFTAPRVARACAALEQLDDAERGAQWLKCMAATWPRSELTTFVRAAQSMPREGARGSTLASMVAVWGADTPRELAHAATSLRDPQQRAMLLGEIALRASPVDEHRLALALHEAQRCRHEQRRLETIVILVRRAGVATSSLIDALFEYFDSRPRAALGALRAIAPVLDTDRARALLRALPWPKLRDTPAECAALLRAMAPALGPTGLSDLLRGLPQWCGDGHGARELQRLAQTIVEPIAQATALEGARAVRSEGDRVHALLAIAGKLNGPHQREVVAMLAATPFTAERTRRLLAVRPGLKPDAILAWNEAAATVTHAELAEMLEQASSRSDEPPPQQSTLAGPPHDRRLDALIAALPMHRPHEPNRESAPVAAPPTHGVSVLLRRMALLEAEADRHASLMQALPGLSPGQRATVLEQLPVHFGFERRAQILVDMAPGLGDADRSAWVSQLIAIDRTALLETILLEARPPDRDALRGELLQALRDAMQRHDGIDRPGFLRLLGAWAPAVVTIGGEDAAVQMIQAIDEFGRAWH